MLSTELLGIVWRASLLMAFGLMAACIVERRSAILAHRILAVTGLCLVLLPIVSQVGPNWEWTGPAWLVGTAPALSPPADQPVAMLPTTAAAPASQVALPMMPTTTNASSSRISMWMSLWLVGTMLMSLRLGVALRRLRNALVHSDEAASTLTIRAQSMALALGIHARLVLDDNAWRWVRSLRRSVSARQTYWRQTYNRIQIRLARTDSMPMVCWFGSWILVLPAHFESWDEDVQRATLSHELGHIARRDVWVDYLIQGLACVLWWHPLMWTMVRNVTRLRELACDEWVLQTRTVSAHSYAHSLLEVVRKCQVDRWQLATPMATKGELESRLRSIASPAKTKKVRTLWLAVCGLAVIPIAGVIAMVSFVNDQSQANAQAAPGVFGEDVPPSDRGGGTITGVVTHDGQPVTGIKVKLLKGLKDGPIKLHAVTTTDEKGRYAIPGMHPGDGYQIEIQSKGHLMVRDWQHQSPYVVTYTGVEGETIELPDAKMVSNQQVLKGIVVDPAGAPVAGVSVTANLASGKMLTKASSGQAPWTQTDQLGGFTLRDLPEEAIELMTYRSNPNGGRILHPCKLKVGLNQQDIRIVYDPRLGTGIEDLDGK